MPLLVTFADERQRYSIENVADDFEEIILEELDFEREASIMATIEDNFADDERIVVPTTYPELCSERIVAMEHVDGEKITDEDVLADVGIEPTEMATLIARTYLQMGLVDGVFHADPHPGNLAVTDDGRLVIYDYGMSQRLTQQEQDDITSLYRTLVRRDVDGLLNTLIALDVLDRSVDRVAVRRVLELVIENLEGKSDVSWREIITELFATLHEFPFRIPPNVMLLVRVGTVGEGVCRTLDPEFDFIAVTRSFLVEQGVIESEVEALLADVRTDLQDSAPALARARRGSIPSSANSSGANSSSGPIPSSRRPVESPRPGTRSSPVPDRCDGPPDVSPPAARGRERGAGGRVPRPIRPSVASPAGVRPLTERRYGLSPLRRDDGPATPASRSPSPMARRMDGNSVPWTSAPMIATPKTIA